MNSLKKRDTRRFCWVHPAIKIEGKATSDTEIVVFPDGRVESEWWTPELDEILSEVGVPREDSARNPFCG